jgi:hypothetical protein
MTEGCAAVIEAKQIAVVAERKLVQAVSGSSCVVIRSGQVGTEALRGRARRCRFLPCLAQPWKALTGPRLVVHSL